VSQYDHSPQLDNLFLTRRQLLGKLGNGFAALGMSGVFAQAGLMGSQTAAHADEVGTGYRSPLMPKAPHFAPKAKRVIFIFANGGPSHVDTFDPKPMLTKYHGQPLPFANLPTERKTGAAYKSPFTFKKYGQSGLEISEIFSNIAEKHADDLCVINGMYADIPNHEPSLMLMNCGESRQVRPCFGSWVTYGLGSENQNLPGFVAMCPRGYPIQESQNWQNGFLPGVYQGMYVDPAKMKLDEIIENIQNGLMKQPDQRAELDLVKSLNERHLQQRQKDADLEARIHSFELAYRMQMDASDAFDVDKESEATKERYGKGVFARQMIIARRLLERGVRFVQLYHGEGQPWDNHDDIEVNHRNLARESDKPIAALLTDLKERGMFEDTLVIWGGEFGRTPTVELPTPGSNAGKVNGRDHNSHGFSMWLAGGGSKGGQKYGATDDFGFKAETDKVHVHDLHATLLKLLGFDHTRLTYRFAGRDYRLTDVYGNVVDKLIA
jgi:hypothetical protein